MRERLRTTDCGLRTARLGVLVVALIALGSATGHAQSRAHVRDAGPGPSGRMLRSVLTGPYELRYVADADTLGPRRVDTIQRRGAGAARGDTTDAVRSPQSAVRSVVAINSDIVAEGHVRGDLVVISGDLYLHPGAVIDGRAIAIGGGVYNSTLAIVRGGRFSFRDNTFRPTVAGDSVLLDFQSLGYPESGTVFLPGIFGFRIPTYDRVNGLSLAFGPTIAFRRSSIEIDPVVTWRSDLGEVDPSVVAAWQATRRNRFEAEAGRYTISNDRWIRGDIVNSLAAFALGRDSRNYFRADRAELRAARMFETATMVLVPWVGARVERAWSVASFDTTSSPWSVLGRNDVEEGMLRPNPPIDRGRISSGLAGVWLEWEQQRVRIEVRGMLESAFDAPVGGTFQQGTVNTKVSFPTFRDHTYDNEIHVVGTTGSETPRQRWVYLGGSGTLSTLDLLVMGGDRLLFVEQSYNVPFERIVIPMLGSPIVSLRHRFGSAGIGGLPDYVQNVGVRLTIGFGRVEYAYDPAARESNLGFGLALGR